MKPEMTSPGSVQPSDGLPRPTEPVSSCVDLIILAILSGGIALVVFLRHMITLISTFSPDGAPRVAALIGIGAQFIILSAILVPLALLWPSPRRKTYQAWLIAHALTLLLACGYFFPFTAIYWQAAYHILIGLIFLPLLFFINALFSRQKTKSGQAQLTPATLENAPQNAGVLWLSAAIIAVFSSLPWLLNGALGSVMDTLLMTLTGLIFGVSAAVVFRLFFVRQDRHVPASKAATLLDALGYSVFLLLLAGGLSFCFGGVQLLAMISLSPAGFLVVFLSALLGRGPSAENEQTTPMTTLRNAAPLAVMTGLLLSYPLVFFDPDELVLVLSDNASEVLAKAFQAALFAALIVLAFTLVVALGLALRKQSASSMPAASEKGRKRLVHSSLLLLFVLGFGASVLLYLTRGQPGFYGDRYFVIMKDQADLTGFSQGGDYWERRQGIYERLTEHSDQSQAEIRAALDRFSIHYTPYYLVNGLEIDGNLLVKLWLSTRPEVDRILENSVLRPLPGPVPPSGGSSHSPDGTLWNLSLIQADRVWNEFGVRGQGIVIGQSDSGVQGDHPQLYDSYRGRTGGNDYNWLDPWNHSPAPVDISGHGTHTLGTILGDTTGVAPDAEWIACVNLARNLGSPTHYLDCMQFSFAPYPQAGDSFKDGDPSKGAHVLNNSWGCPEIEGCDAEVFHPAVRALREAGVFVVGSAGNDGPKCGSLNVPPPIYSEVFAVGAIDQFSNLAFFSSIGPVSADQSGRVKPDLVAPGVQVLSSLPLNTYGEFSGTSMAGPHVVGVVALMWSANPALIGDIETTEQILIESADPYRGVLPDCPGADQIPSAAVGYGIVNAYNAVQMALQR